MLKKQQNDPLPPELSRREREIMDIIYRLGEATVNEVLDERIDVGRVVERLMTRQLRTEHD